MGKKDNCRCDSCSKRYQVLLAPTGPTGPRGDGSGQTGPTGPALFSNNGSFSNISPLVSGTPLSLDNARSSGTMQIADGAFVVGGNGMYFYSYKVTYDVTNTSIPYTLEMVVYVNGSPVPFSGSEVQTVGTGQVTSGLIVDSVGTLSGSGTLNLMAGDEVVLFVDQVTNVTIDEISGNSFTLFQLN